MWMTALLCVYNYDLSGNVSHSMGKVIFVIISVSPLIIIILFWKKNRSFSVGLLSGAILFYFMVINSLRSSKTEISKFAGSDVIEVNLLH